MVLLSLNGSIAQEQRKISIRDPLVSMAPHGPLLPAFRSLFIILAISHLCTNTMSPNKQFLPPFKCLPCSSKFSEACMTSMNFDECCLFFLFSFSFLFLFLSMFSFFHCIATPWYTNWVFGVSFFSALLVKTFGKIYRYPILHLKFMSHLCYHLCMELDFYSTFQRHVTIWIDHIQRFN